MQLYALGTQKLETGTLGAKVSYGFLFVLVAGDVVAEVGLHVLEGERLLHLKF